MQLKLQAASSLANPEAYLGSLEHLGTSLSDILERATSGQPQQQHENPKELRGLCFRLPVLERTRLLDVAAESLGQGIHRFSSALFSPALESHPFGRVRRAVPHLQVS
ncbi:UNVERIFIED_CONTAM: hypothetical protein K2H54_045446 [Gekko kuhli]